MQNEPPAAMSSLPLMVALLGMSAVFLLEPPVISYARRKLFFQRSSELHHTHKTPVPRLGGVALAAAFIIIELVTLLFPEQHKWQERMVLAGSSLGMFGLGFWDDLRPLGAKRKLLVQVLIASVVCCFGIGITSFKIPFSDQVVELGSWGVLLTIFWLVSMTNLINLIDGVDGLAGGICFMLMALLA